MRIGAVVLLAFPLTAAGCSSCRGRRSTANDAAPISKHLEAEGEIEPALVAVDDDTFVAASMHVRGAGATELFVRVSRDAGKTWSDARSIHAQDATNVADPSLVRAANGDIFLVFLAFSTQAQGGEPRGMSIQVARAPHDSLVFERPRALSTNDAARLDKPWSAIDARDRLLVAARWETETARGIDVYTLDGDGFARRTIESAPAFDGELPTICAGEKKTLVAWVDPDPGPRPRVVAHVRGDDDDWGAPIVLSEGDEAVALEAPSCVVSTDGAHVVYGLTKLPFDGAASPILDACVRLRVVDRTPDVRETWPVSRALHPAIVDLGGGSTAVAYYVMGERDDEIGAMTVRFWSPPLSRALPVRARRDDPAWAGDYLGVAFAGRTLVVASIDASSGARRLVFDAASR